MKESEMEELKKDMQKMADQAKVDINYDPVSETDRHIRDAIDGKSVDNLPAPIPEDPDRDYKVHAAEILPVQQPETSSDTPPAQTASPHSQPAPDSIPARKVGEA
jgi:hypothetical protein